MTNDVTSSGNAGMPDASSGSVRPCVKCGYNLSGLPETGKCPECATPVADSLRGFLLRFASPEWLAKIDSGLGMVLNGILLAIIVGVLGVATTLLAGAVFNSASVVAVMGIALDAVLIGVQAMIFLGYIKWTEPDPGYTGIENPGSARQYLRWAVVAGLGIAALGLVVQLAFAGGGGNTMLGYLARLLSLAGWIATAVQYFAAILYTRWMASRVPDDAMVKKTKLYIWLLPLLTTVGILLIGLGPLVALVLYWNMLNALRKHVKASRGPAAA